MMQRNPLAYQFKDETSDTHEMMQVRLNFSSFFNRNGQHIISDVEALSGGLTNKTYLVRTNSSQYIAREPGVGSEKYINRGNEAADTANAHAKGVTPEVVYDNKKGWKVTRYLPQPTALNVSLLRRPECLLQVVDVLKRLHSGKPCAETVDVFARNRQWCELVGHQGYLLPVEYLDLMVPMNQIEEAIKRFSITNVPCHNDPTPGNFILSQGKMQIIDFEYAGNNDPVWDLAYLAVEADFTQQQSEFMLRAYFNDQLTEEIKQRFKLYQPVVHYTNAIWAFMQIVMNNHAKEQGQIHALQQRSLSLCRQLLEMDSIKALNSEPVTELRSSVKDEDDAATSGCCAWLRRR